MGKLAERRHSLITDPWEVYPELQPLRSALSAADWRAVRALLLRWEDPDEQAMAVCRLVNWPGSETMLARAVAADPEDTAAKALLGARTLIMGWDVRGGGRASTVSREQFDVFHDHVQRADVMFREVLARDPGNVCALEWRITAARALSMGQSETMRRWSQLAAHRPHMLAGQQQTLQGLLPKWGGSWERAWDFAVGCARSAPPGAPNPVLVADYHLERWLEESDEAYLAAHRHDLAYAADYSVLHPDYRPRLGWVGVHNMFAMALGKAGEFDRAAKVFDRLENRVSEHPWGYGYVSPVAGFARLRKQSYAASGSG